LRYVDSLNLKETIECFVLIEPGLGYIIPVLREKFKTSKIIALHVNTDFKQQSGVPALFGTDAKEVQKFLEAEIPEIEASRIRIIEWRPSLNYYKEEYLKLLSTAVEFIKRMDAGNRTTAAFGKRWVRNFFRNLNFITECLLYKETDIPIIITGSGPGLEEAMPVIKEGQNNCLVIAASSSVMALSRGGVTADIVISTDGGNWALNHIYECCRTKTAAIAASLTAALPSQCSGTPRLIINDGSFWQSVVLHELGLPSVIIPQRGTVTATAIELALILSRGNVYLAGIDLCVKDIRTHARPYAFDNLLSGRASRFTPVYSQVFVRSSLIRKGGSMDIYAAWFKNQLASWPKRIFSIGGSSEVFGSSIPFDPAALEQTAVKRRDCFNTMCVNGEPELFCKRGADALLTEIKKTKFAQKIKNELTPLLFPGENKVTEQELENAIKETACKEVL